MKRRDRAVAADVVANQIDPGAKRTNLRTLTPPGKNSTGTTEVNSLQLDNGELA